MQFRGCLLSWRIGSDGSPVSAPRHECRSDGDDEKHKNAQERQAAMRHGRQDWRQSWAQLRPGKTGRAATAGRRCAYDTAPRAEMRDARHVARPSWPRWPCHGELAAAIMAEAVQLLPASSPMTPALVHAVFFVSLTTTAGLVAIWAAVSPRHRLVRVAVFCAIPLVLWLAPADELARDVLLEMAATVGLIVVARFVAQAPHGQTWGRLPRLRFNLGTLFYAVFLSALIASAASLFASGMADWDAITFLRWFLDPLALSLALGARPIVPTVTADGSSASWHYRPVALPEPDYGSA